MAIDIPDKPLLRLSNVPDTAHSQDPSKRGASKADTAKGIKVIYPKTRKVDNERYTKYTVIGVYDNLN